MKKFLFGLLLIEITVSSLNAQNTFTPEGKVSFYSNAPLEKTEANNNNATNVLDAESGKLEFTFRIYPPVGQIWWLKLAAVLLALAGFIYLQKFRERRLQRVNHLKRQKVESELAALKAHINPHFLFNSFNALIDAIEDNPKKAVEYVEKLSDFFRSLLRFGDYQVIPVAEEIRLIRNFEFLLRKRFGENIDIRVDLENENGFIPPLTLLMLVENAVKHNVISQANPLLVEIKSEENQYIKVINNLQRKLSTDPTTRFGLQDLMKRYQLLGAFKVHVKEDAHRFEVSVPICPIAIVDESSYH